MTVMEKPRDVVGGVLVAGIGGTAHGSGLTGADHGAASVEGRTMRRRSGRARRKPPGRPAARSRIAYADHGRSFGGSSVDAQPFEEHRRTRVRRLSGRCRLNGRRRCMGGMPGRDFGLPSTCSAESRSATRKRWSISVAAAAPCFRLCAPASPRLVSWASTAPPRCLSARAVDSTRTARIGPQTGGRWSPAHGIRPQPCAPID